MRPALISPRAKKKDHRHYHRAKDVMMGPVAAMARIQRMFSRRKASGGAMEFPNFEAFHPERFDHAVTADVS